MSTIIHPAITAYALRDADMRPISARSAYEADVAKRPRYHDGTPRKTWEQLGELERSTWVPRL